MEIHEIIEAVHAAGFNGVTFSGGDPLYQAEELTPLAAILKNEGYDIWCYTGFSWEDIAGKATYEPLLRHIDVLVDGPFIQSRRDTSLIFRGSDNQRLILLSRSSEENITLYSPDNLPVF